MNNIRPCSCTDMEPIYQYTSKLQRLEYEPLFKNIWPPQDAYI